MEELEPSPALYRLVNMDEGCRLTAYWDVNGWAIGWGYHGPEVTEGMQISQVLADSLRQKKIDEAAASVRFLTRGLKVTQGQFDALVDFEYNCGAGALERSDLLRYFRAGNIAAAAAEFTRWDHIRRKGHLVEDPKLLERRKVERRMFLGTAA